MVQPFSEEIKQQWKEDILKQRKSKLSIASWCRQNGIAVHTFYYWQNRLFPKPVFSRAAFSEAVEEKNKSSTGIILEYQGFNIHLGEYFNPSVLKKMCGGAKKMLSIPGNARLFICQHPVNMRKSFEGLSALVEELFPEELLSGALFIFLTQR